jgi:hypothetical protein
VNAAVISTDYLYVLSADRLTKLDLEGHAHSTHRLQFHHGFRPIGLSVAGDALYAVDRGGRVEWFQLN